MVEVEVEAMSRIISHKYEEVIKNTSVIISFFCLTLFLYFWLNRDNERSNRKWFAALLVSISVGFFMACCKSFVCANGFV